MKGKIISALKLLFTPVAFAFLLYFAWQSRDELTQLINDAIPDSRYRATLLSVESIFDRAACAWIVSLSGGFVARGEIPSYLYISSIGVFLLVAAATIGIRIAKIGWHEQEIKGKS